jgi:putative tryptophan/tyrosine transport system substrate-binding protein
MTIRGIGRRAFIAALGGGAAWTLAARAQQPTKPLIGILQAGSAASTAGFIDAFRDGMRQLGYTEGRNVRFESRFADGVIERLPRLAAELVELKPDVIVSGPLPANLAVHKATSTIPIVMGTGADPVGFRLVNSLARPGGNVTGVTNFAEELASKQLDIMRELLPHLSRAGVLVNVTNPLHVPQWRETQAAADKASLKLVAFEMQKVEDLPAAFATFARERAEALLVPPDVTFNAYHRQISELAAAARLPAIYFNRVQAENGGLISYGPDVREGYRRAATYADKILKGAKPGDLPIERPTKIELAINTKVAKALGIEIPPQLLARADEVIE